MDSVLNAASHLENKDGSGSDFTNGVPGPGPLNRNISVGMQGLMDSILMPPALERTQSSGASGAPQAGSIEEQVYFILAKMYAPKDTGDVGFAAFDRNKKLLGFYQENKTEQTECQFFALADIYQHYQLPEDTPKTLNKLLEDNQRNASAAVHSRNNYASLVAMREDALMYHWSKCLMLM
jgi:hypothetical protein